MSEAWYGAGGEDLPEFPKLRQGKLKPGATVFNLGAHHGVVALRLASEVSPGGKVVAVESNPASAAVARRNVELNLDYAVVIENKAVGAQFGQIRVSSDWGNQSVGVGAHTVDVITVDDLSARHGAPDVVYMDIEGWEQQALKGASETLKHGPDWCVEVHTGCGLEAAGGSVDELIEVFLGRGYSLLAIIEDEAGCSAISPCTPGSAGLRKRFHLVAFAAQR